MLGSRHGPVGKEQHELFGEQPQHSMRERSGPPRADPPHPSPRRAGDRTRAHTSTPANLHTEDLWKVSEVSFGTGAVNRGSKSLKIQHHHVNRWKLRRAATLGLCPHSPPQHTHTHTPSPQEGLQLPRQSSTGVHGPGWTLGLSCLALSSQSDETRVLVTSCLRALNRTRRGSVNTKEVGVEGG